MLTRILSAFGYERRATDSPFAPDAWGRAIRSRRFSNAQAKAAHARSWSNRPNRRPCLT